MEPPADPGSYYHHHQPPPPPPQRYSHHHHQPPPPPPTTTTNAILPTTTTTDSGPPQMLYSRNSVPSSAVSPPLQSGVRRKRGRPRKYSTPEQAAEAKRLSSATVSPFSSPSKKDVSSSAVIGGSSKKSSVGRSQIVIPSVYLGNGGQGFTPYIITVTAGEDINHKIMSFMQQSKQEICIISASGVISNATLRQPATSGGNITYEGRFDILSLCGSYVRSDFRSSSGGLSICLSSNDGQIIGGGVDGPLIAGGPVQVILGAFVISGKNAAMLTKDDASVGPSFPPSAPESSARNSVVGNDVNHQNSDGYPFMIPNGGMPVATDWRNNIDSRGAPGFNFSGIFFC
ncbi:hypothetical protein OSB04_016885 [Centaurea solstitialis]|uniref:AT-hook motif nuclear-localized protein n=1 Tax=Centaurea solstitialis TaxID=347529 RepID=A0AA38T1U8_9ASTR|nr:hypothetical protein OSB04_016885 [Centaurea solstitialis]